MPVCRPHVFHRCVRRVIPRWAPFTPIRRICRMCPSPYIGVMPRTLTKLSRSPACTSLLSTRRGADRDNSCGHPVYDEFNPSSRESKCPPNSADWMNVGVGMFQHGGTYPEEVWNCIDIGITSGERGKARLGIGYPPSYWIIFKYSPRGITSAVEEGRADSGSAGVDAVFKNVFAIERRYRDARLPIHGCFPR